MNIVIRTDASTQIGTGHVMRCLVLAEELRRHGATITFICRPLHGDVMHSIKVKGFSIESLPPLTSENDHHGLIQNWKTDAYQTINILKKQSSIDWLIIDHYAIDKKWERAIKPYVNKRMVIDDLANRPHDCELLLDQNLYKNIEKHYESLLPDHTVTLLGPTYLLLREEFSDITSRTNKQAKTERILIAFGGSDPTNETMKALKAITRINPSHIAVDVVVGSANQNAWNIRQFCRRLPHITVHYNIDYAAELMSKADLAIGAGGTMTWERCFLGLPAITIETATNQAEILSYVSELGAIRHLGISQKVTENDIANELQTCINCPAIIQDMIKASHFMMKNASKSLVTKHLIEGAKQ